jgi:hypothetical protein
MNAADHMDAGVTNANLELMVRERVTGKHRPEP